MTITIADIEFDHVFYDVEGDVLYLSVGPPRAAVKTHESPSGHFLLRYDESKALIGVTILNAKWLIDQHAPLELSDDEHVDPRILEPALA